MRRTLGSTVLTTVVVAGLAAGAVACDRRRSVEVTTAAAVPSSTVPEVELPETTVPPEPSIPSTTVPVTLTVPTLPTLPTVRVTVPPVTLPPVTVPPVNEPNPLPVPVLVDVRQGFGPPCDAPSAPPPKGCYFFVYATTATKGWDHRLYSGHPFRTEYTLPTSGNACGTEHTHHMGEELCEWYIGPVQDRTVGENECFWLTTVEGTRESEPSAQVCMTWTEGANRASPSG